MKRLQAVNIRGSYGKKKVLCGVDISAEAGQCVGIVGTNGCGKSTLLNILAGMRKADSGDIYFDGTVVRNQQDFIRFVGYVPQENHLIPELRVLDNLRLWYRDANALRQSLEQGFLKALGVDEMCQIKAGKLSGGMKKRVSIGCALAGNPPILILDEPDAALDLPGKADIRRYLALYRQMGGTILLATHDEPDLDLCDRVFALCKGVSKEISRTLRGEALLKQIKE
ncbi:MAG: ATP-binding cassette domain-containing protein [Lachnospiraceae bacterium]|nr:ATP-binding cassette domain-containing protein [Lachnospiraceae bacterium]